MNLYMEKEPIGLIDIIVDNNLHCKSVLDRKQRERLLCVGCGFDIETSKIHTDYGDTGYVYHWQFSMNDDTIMGRSLDTMKQFFSMLIEKLENMPENPKLLVLDANLGYEFQYCKKVWYELNMDKLFAKEKRNPLKLEIGGHLIMREVIGLFGNNLAQIAKNYTPIKKLKGDLDYSIFRTSTTEMTAKEIGYCVNDVQILSHLGRYIFEHYYGKHPTLPLTSTGIIRNKIKRKLGKNLSDEKKKIQSWLPSEKDYDLHRNYLFKGGICGTNSFYMDEILSNVVCADYTSDYPACMNHYDFPMGKCEEIPTNEFMKEKAKPYIAVFRFLELSSTTTHSLMTKHKCLNKATMTPINSIIDNGRIFRADEAVLVLNDVEFKSFCKAYKFSKKSQILRCWTFERYGRLPEHVLSVLNEEYLKKEQLKADGLNETLEYKDSKAAVNGTFGMMCTSIFTEELELRGYEIDNPRDAEGYPIEKSFDDAIKGMFLYPYWGYWITSYARSLLIDVITRFPELIIQYDTDSIYYYKDHPDSAKLEQFIVNYNEKMFRLNDILFDNNPHFRDLGAWDVEPPYKRFKGLGSKRYMCEKANGKIKVTVTGCRKIEMTKEVLDSIKYPNSYKEGDIISTIQYQNDYNNAMNGTNIDIFDFFKDDMKIDKEHSNKLASSYVDEEIIVDYNGERLVCPSAVVLKEIEFNMGIAATHEAFYESMKIKYKNCPGKSDLRAALFDYLEVAILGEDKLHRKRRRKRN